MKKFYAKKQGDCFIIDDDELTHFNVLRCKVGEQILCLGCGHEDYLCKVSEINKKFAVAKIVSSVPNTKNPQKNLTIYQALLKGEKADLVTQKLTELGASNLIMFESEFCVAKSSNNKIDRLNKISQEACKQCGRNIPLNILDTIKFTQMIEELNGYDLVLFANEKNCQRNLNEFKSANNIALIIGSEGGFSDTEIQQITQAGAVNFGLGQRILRAETAAIAMTAIVGHIFEV